MARIDEAYKALLYDIKENGVIKDDRTGTGTRSVFGRMIKHDMRTGFPLLTLKETWWKGIVHELLWFIKGGENIKYLVDNNVNIWNEWPHRDYVARWHETEKKRKFLSERGVRDSFMMHSYDAKEPASIEKFKELIKNDPQFAEVNGYTGPIYGSQWVNFNGDGINQIQEAIDTLKTNPDSRRILVTALNPSKLKEMTLDPCHYSFQFETHKIPTHERIELYAETINDSSLDELSLDEIEVMMDKVNFPSRYVSLLWNQRSVDTFLGLPFNIASYALLLKMFADQVNMIPYELTGMLGDTHIYNDHKEQMEEVLTHDTERFDAPDVSIKEKDSIFDYEFDDFKLISYGSFGKIKAKISV